MLQMEKTVLKVGDEVFVERGRFIRRGEVVGHSTTMRDRETMRALVRVRLFKGDYPSSVFKDTELLKRK